jgi:putative drug exporter of the RND superfamily
VPPDRSREAKPGRRATSIGFHSSPQIEAWIPVFLFAVIFGISMDYEVFLLSRVREEWDRTHDNEHAVAYGLEHTGRIITAAAIVMIAAFSGFMTGRFVGLQEFGLGLSAAIFLDATIVRALLVPSVMKLLGDWNWYLPDGMRKAMRLRPRPELGRRSDRSARLPAS